MPKRVINYETWLSEELQDPEIAANYLSAAIEDSPQMFLEALKDVAQAHQVAHVARKAGVKRESLYKAFSEEGNPTFDTLHSVLNVFGVKMEFAPSASPAAEGRGSKRKHISLGYSPRKNRVTAASVDQLSLPLGSPISASLANQIVPSVPMTLAACHQANAGEGLDDSFAQARVFSGTAPAMFAQSGATGARRILPDR